MRAFGQLAEVRDHLHPEVALQGRRQHAQTPLEQPQRKTHGARRVFAVLHLTHVSAIARVPRAYSTMARRRSVSAASTRRPSRVSW